jgi:putative FmdB family regulatory protein
MPIFEYKCRKCNSKFDVLHKSSLNQEEVFCPNCKSTENQKLLSTFSATGFSTTGTSCESGNCAIPQNPLGGCASGMCGLN